MVTDTKLQVTNLHTMTQKKAMYLLKTVWPEAPDTEVIKAAMICQTYGLNPLLRQVSLIKFGSTWVTVLGIKATRNIALQTGHKWSYVTGPRVMTDEEQKQIFGESYPDRIVAITKIRDEKGNEYPGYGFISRSEKVHGLDKGNTVANMAFIRSERNALDKMAPGELPPSDVIDEEFVQVDNVREAIKEGQHEAALESESDINELWDANEAPVPIAVVTESRAWDIKTLIDESGATKKVMDFMIQHYGKLVPIRRLTNEQADAICKLITNKR